MKLLLNKTVGGYAVLAACVTGLIGLIFYIVTSTTGYLAGLPFSALPIVLTLLAIAIGGVLFLIPEKLNRILEEVLFAALIILLIASCLLFFNARVDLAADVYFIPVNYPAAEETALNVSIVGVVFYFLAIISTIVAGFCDKLIKE